MAAPTLWRVEDGEEARLTPGGEAAAIIVSRGTLPFRLPRPGSSHQRPAFPGTAVLLGEGRFEVLSERQEGGDRTVYLLNPWPEDHIIRTQIAYGPDLIRGVQQERRRARVQRLGRRFAWPLYPILGLLPEERQVEICDRLGLDPGMATFASGLSEAALLLLSLRAFTAAYGLAAAAVLVGATKALGYYMAFAVLRGLGALAFGEVAGSLGLTVVWRAAERLGLLARRARERDKGLRRGDFWEWLTVPDSQARLEDGSILVGSPVPHLTWNLGTNLRSGDDWWLVCPLPPVPEAGRWTFRYVLSPAAEAPFCDPPGPLAYQATVRDQVEAEWYELRASGLDPLISLFPRDVQLRAVDKQGGPAALRRGVSISIAGTTLAALWFGLGAGVLNVLTAFVLAIDAAQRLRRLALGQYAPSLIGGLIGSYVRPERVAYQAHREAVLRAVDCGSRPPGT